MKGKFPGQDSELQIGVTTDQKAEDHSGNAGYYLPLRGGQDTNLEDSMLSPMLNSPTGFMQQAFPGALDPGTPVVVMREIGSLGGLVLGQSNTVKKGGTGASNSSLPSAQKVKQLTGTERDINIAPDIEETEENGVKIRKIKEKGQLHSLDLLDGLPIHGALFDMAGFRLPEIKNVPTAKQTNDQMMSAQQLQQMMGQIMSMGQMIQGLAGNKGGGGGAGGYGAGSLAPQTPGTTYTPPGANTGAGGAGYSGGLGNNIISAANAPSDTPLYSIMEGVTPPMKAAINSLSVLLQGYETTGGVAFVTGGVVHEDTYLQNAEQLLSQVNTLDDLMYVLSRLQWDSSLRGTEKLQSVVNEIQTAWGVALQEIDYNGNIIITYGSADANLEMDFANTMTSNTSSPALGYFSGNDPTYSINATGASQGFNSGSGIGGAGGQGSSSSAQQVMGQVQGLLGQIQGLAQGMDQNMFGEAAGTMKDMWKRMTREQENDAKKMHEKLNQASDTQKMSKIVEKTVKGGKPLDTQNFDENSLESMGESAGSGNFGVSFGP